MLLLVRVKSLVSIGHESLKTTPRLIRLIRLLLPHALILIFVSRTGSQYSRNGTMSGWALVVSILCFICSWFATRACAFVKIYGRLSKESPYGERGPPHYGVGLFRCDRGSGGGDGFAPGDLVPQCTHYTRDLIDNASYFDGAFKASRAFSIMANICIFVGMICFMGSCCVEFKPKTMKSLGYLFAAASIFHLLTFSLYASSLCDEFKYCRFAGGSAFAILSMILALVTAVLAFRIRPKDPETPLPARFAARALPTTKPKTVTETVMPDDTKKITEITVNVDGSQTVTETYIRLIRPEEKITEITVNVDGSQTVTESVIQPEKV
jgi:hypothetical protein